MRTDKEIELQHRYEELQKESSAVLEKIMAISKKKEKDNLKHMIGNFYEYKVKNDNNVSYYYVYGFARGEQRKMFKTIEVHFRYGTEVIIEKTTEFVSKFFEDTILKEITKKKFMTNYFKAFAKTNKVIEKICRKDL